jgi:hypothetical protein
VSRGIRCGRKSRRANPRQAATRSPSPLSTKGVAPGEAGRGGLLFAGVPIRGGSALGGRQCGVGGRYVTASQALLATGGVGTEQQGVRSTWKEEARGGRGI